MDDFYYLKGIKEIEIFIQPKYPKFRIAKKKNL